MNDTKSQTPKQRIKPPVVGTEQVQCSCGHECTFELFADKQDKFRVERRNKITSRPCRECRLEIAKAHNQKPKVPGQTARDRNQAKRQDRKRNQMPSLPGRLPHLSHFQLTYCAESEEWVGNLTVDGTVFTGKHSAVFKLLRLLDSKYREAKALVENGPQS